MLEGPESGQSGQALIPKAVSFLLLLQNTFFYLSQIWRRSYDTPPPALEPSDPRSATNEPKYAVSNTKY